jgi:SAM-dependent methyltransferase
MIHRKIAYSLLSGTGIEIGAFHQPANLPNITKVFYCDAVAREDAIKLFPELEFKDLVPVDFIIDLDKSGLVNFEESQFDFVVINHVIEHVANPINVIKELFRVVKPGGFVVISAPDKNFTFDIKRDLTSFEHLYKEFKSNVDIVGDDHFLDFLKGVHPEVFDEGDNHPKVEVALGAVRARREHAHVWSTDTFEIFMQQSLEMLGIKSMPLYLSRGDENKFEYFSIWKRNNGTLDSALITPIQLAEINLNIFKNKVLFKIKKLRAAFK